MSLETIINMLAGRPKQYKILDRGTESTLQNHAEQRMAEVYGGLGTETSSDWIDVKQEMVQGPGTLKTGDELHDFSEGLGNLPYNANTPQGAVYDVDGSAYTVFYFEPFTNTEIVEEDDRTSFIASPYVLGETLEFSNLENENTNYTFAELRSAEEPLTQSLYQQKIQRK